MRSKFRLSSFVLWRVQMFKHDLISKFQMFDKQCLIVWPVDLIGSRWIAGVDQQRWVTQHNLLCWWNHSIGQVQVQLAIQLEWDIVFVKSINYYITVIILVRQSLIYIRKDYILCTFLVLLPTESISFGAISFVFNGTIYEQRNKEYRIDPWNDMTIGT